jgi:hypothetical protein
MKRYGIDLQFSDSTIRWEDSRLPMHAQGFYTEERASWLSGRGQQGIGWELGVNTDRLQLPKDIHLFH